MTEPVLQALRVPAGWRIDWNQFYAVDPSPETRDWFQASTLLAASNDQVRRALELEFQPQGDPAGRFLLSLYGPPTEQPRVQPKDYELLACFESPSRVAIVEVLEQAMATLKLPGL